MFGKVVDIHNLTARKGAPDTYPGRTEAEFVVSNRTPVPQMVRVKVSYISDGREVDSDERTITLGSREDRKMYFRSDWVVERVEAQASWGPLTLDSESTDP